MHPSIPALLTYFSYDHLLEDLQEIPKLFHDLAHQLVDTLGESTNGKLDAGPQLNRSLQKLLESKDAAVRAAVRAGSGDMNG